MTNATAASRAVKHSNLKSGLKFALTALAALAAGGAVAAPQTFTATATVQNAVTLTQTTPMNFGTVFATATSAGAAADATFSQRLSLTPTGAATAANLAAGGTTLPGKLLSLGGGVAGVFTAPGLPSNGTVGVRLTDSDNVVGFVNAVDAAAVTAASCVYDTPALAIAAGQVVLANGADPSVAFFCVNGFTSNRLNLLGDTLVPATGYGLGFGVSALTFNLGASLITQAPADGVKRLYQPGAYTGTFGMEVVFP